MDKDSTVIETILTYHKTTQGGQRVYRNRDGDIRDIYVPSATADRLGNPDQIKIAVEAG
jgi:hypothetical protein